MTYENTLRSGALHRLVVAAEDPEIVEHVQSFGGEAFLTGIHPSGTDRVADVVHKHLMEADIIVNVQADEPCLDPQIIEKLVSTLRASPSAVITTPVSPIADQSQISNPSCVKCVFDQQGRALYFSRAPIPFTQKNEIGVTYYRHIGVYCFRRSFLLQYAALPKSPLQQIEDLEQLKILEHGWPIHVCLVAEPMAGVDTPADFEKIERYLCQNTSSSQAALSPH